MLRSRTKMQLPRFLNYFEYESTEQGEQNTTYLNCTILRPMGQYQVGDKVDAINIILEFYIWEGEEMTEDVVIAH